MHQKNVDGFFLSQLSQNQLLPIFKYPPFWGGWTVEPPELEKTRSSSALGRVANGVKKTQRSGGHFRSHKVVPHT